MTREDIITQAAQDYATLHHPEWDSACYRMGTEYSESALHDKAENSFLAGARWADANRWVCVDDALPETSNDNILVYYDGEDGIFYDIVVFDATTKSWYGLFGYQIPTPKMYMYITEPPKAEQ